MTHLVRNFFLLFACVSLISACGDLSTRPIGTTSNNLLQSNPSGTNQSISSCGTIRFNDTEGGHFILVADDGSTYLPTALAKEFQVDGLSVHFSGTLATDAYMTEMSGYILNIESIEVAE